MRTRGLGSSSIETQEPRRGLRSAFEASDAAGVAVAISASVIQVRTVSKRCTT